MSALADGKGARSFPDAEGVAVASAGCMSEANEIFGASAEVTLPEEDGAGTLPGKRLDPSDGALAAIVVDCGRGLIPESDGISALADEKGSASFSVAKGAAVASADGGGIMFSLSPGEGAAVFSACKGVRATRVDECPGTARTDEVAGIFPSCEGPATAASDDATGMFSEGRCIKSLAAGTFSAEEGARMASVDDGGASFPVDEGAGA